MDKLLGQLFQKIQNLKLYTQEGVEVQEEDLKFLKDSSILFACDNAQDFNSDQTMNEYDIKCILGQGGFGKVMLGVHCITKEKRAIKIIDALKVGNAQDIDIVFREAEMLKMMNHKHIVKIHNCFTLKNMQVAIIMDYLEGGELLTYIENKQRLSEDEAKNIFFQIADAINYCHSKKIIHRDLKLENIMFEKEDKLNIKVVDFGIAGVANHLNVDALDMGSLRYMTPEIFEGTVEQIGPEIDVWALGVILFAMLCGFLPFDGVTSQDVKNKIIKCDYKIPKYIEVSDQCKDLLSLLLMKNPKKRITVRKILTHSWLELLWRYHNNKLWLDLNSDNHLFTIDIEKEKEDQEQKKLMKNSKKSIRISTILKLPQKVVPFRRVSSFKLNLNSGLNNKRGSSQKQSEIIAPKIIDFQLPQISETLDVRTRQSSVKSQKSGSLLQNEKLKLLTDKVHQVRNILALPRVSRSESPKKQNIIQQRKSNLSPEQRKSDVSYKEKQYVSKIKPIIKQDSPILQDDSENTSVSKIIKTPIHYSPMLKKSNLSLKYISPFTNVKKKLHINSQQQSTNLGIFPQQDISKNQSLDSPKQNLPSKLNYIRSQPPQKFRFPPSNFNTIQNKSALIQKSSRSLPKLSQSSILKINYKNQSSLIMNSSSQISGRQKSQSFRQYLIMPKIERLRLKSKSNSDKLNSKEEQLKVRIISTQSLLEKQYKIKNNNLPSNDKQRLINNFQSNSARSYKSNNKEQINPYLNNSHSIPSFETNNVKQNPNKYKCKVKPNKDLTLLMKAYESIKLKGSGSDPKIKQRKRVPFQPALKVIEAKQKFINTEKYIFEPSKSTIKFRQQYQNSFNIISKDSQELQNLYSKNEQ